ncbi:uncharacterized protein LOC111402077 [Olea europaea var. sylvestris]|uniref:uncharacterized protein LOC111402077 n=1 Tax=Olea europaea var. sylvestris TaxID=158386 RepID=UPI000C1D1D6E|nr:uncharacterized protein LOC111402077 [Olea europaea var. sylvestris]
MGINRNNGESSLVIVVEYLETSMSRDLLYKFPDNSAFDFDYAQSSIWSPLLPPPLHSHQGKGGISRKLSYEEDGLLENTKKMTAKFKRKFANAVFDHLHKYHKMKKRKRKSMEFSSVPSSHQLSPTSSAPRKVWTKVLKAASKHFKKRREIPLP